MFDNYLVFVLINRFQRRNITPLQIHQELSSAVGGVIGSDSSLDEDNVKSVLQFLWEKGLSRQGGLLILNFLLIDENLGPKEGKIVVRNFWVTMIHFVAYAIYCTENNMVGTHLCCKLYSDNGKMTMFAKMKDFITTHHQASEKLEEIVCGLFVAVFKQPQLEKIFEHGLKDVLKKDLANAMENLKKILVNKVKKGVWKNAEDYHFSKSFALHKDILEWLDLV